MARRYKDFKIETIERGYGKGTFQITGIDRETGQKRLFQSGGLLKTPTRAKNWLKKIMGRYS